MRDLLAAFKRAPASSSTTADLLPLAWIPTLVAALLLGLHTATRRTAALIALGGLCLGEALHAQRRPPGETAFEAGLVHEAATLLARDLTPAASDTAYYNAGTALAAAGEYPSAQTALARAARSLDPDLRYRALYNLGVIALRRALTDSTQRDSLLTAATNHLKDALALAPHSARAKWNLELAERRKRPPPAGGGSSPSPPPPPAPPPPPSDRTGQAQSNLSPAQADQVLNSVDREERDTRLRRLGRSRLPAGGVKDW